MFHLVSAVAEASVGSFKISQPIRNEVNVMMMTLKKVQAVPSTPAILADVALTASQRVKIRKAIERVCQKGGTSREALEDEIASLLCERDLTTEREQLTLLPPILDKIRDPETAYQKRCEFKHLCEDVASAESKANRIVEILLENESLVFNGPSVVVCSAWPLLPSSAD